MTSSITLTSVPGLPLVQAGDEVRVSLDLTMAVGAADPMDSIEIEGDPPVHLKVSGGFHGDRATVGTVVITLPIIGDATIEANETLSLELTTGVGVGFVDPGGQSFTGTITNDD